MDKGSGGLEEDRPMRPSQWWGLRPWKRHSTILMVIGFLFALFGVQYITSKPTPARELALAAVLRIAPIHIWGGVFIMVGLLAMISSRWPPIAERWGYMVLTSLSSTWAATYITGMVFFKAPLTNIGQSIIWAALGFMWWAISGLPNPPEKVVLIDAARRS